MSVCKKKSVQKDRRQREREGGEREEKRAEKKKECINTDDTPTELDERWLTNGENGALSLTN